MTGVSGIVTTLLKVFIAAVLAAVLAFNLDVSTHWKAIIMAGVSAVVVFAYNWLNPADARYGVGAAKQSVTISK